MYIIEEPSSTPWVTSGIVPISSGPLQSALFTKSTGAKHTNTEWSSLVWLGKINLFCKMQIKERVENSNVLIVRRRGN